MRAKDFGGCYAILEDMLRTAETLPRAPAVETLALHDLARAMRFWRVIHRSGRNQAPARGREISRDLRDTALHCLIVDGRVGRADFYRFGFEHHDIVAHGPRALAEARRTYALRLARSEAAEGAAA